MDGEVSEVMKKKHVTMEEPPGVRSGVRSGSPKKSTSNSLTDIKNRYYTINSFN